jgi:hypothetical protein
VASSGNCKAQELRPVKDVLTCCCAHAARSGFVVGGRQAVDVGGGV